MVIALRPGTKKEVPELLLGQGQCHFLYMMLLNSDALPTVICMYSNTGAKGARHDDIPVIDGLGAAS